MPKPSTQRSAAARSLHVALLRGVNVGGRNKLSMKTLATFFVDAGCVDVQTYIQSGNVVFAADEALAARVPALVSARIESELGFAAPLVVRSAAAFDAVLAGNPYLAEGADEDALHVLFLAAAPSPAQLASLDPQRSPPDRFAVRGGEIYMWLPNGVARTKLTNAYFDARLDTVCTGRNWRTVRALRDLTRSPPS